MYLNVAQADAVHDASEILLAYLTRLLSACILKYIGRKCGNVGVLIQLRSERPDSVWLKIKLESIVRANNSEFWYQFT
jgi:hypothetical protein